MQHRAITRSFAVVLSNLALLAVGCGGDPDPSSAPDASGATAGTPQLPPRGDVAMRPWLAEGHYLAWTCEAAPHPARPPGAHGTNRICSNAALSASTSGEFPVGAASVKELHGSNGISGYAASVKVAPGSSASSWYWYEVIGDNVVADGPAIGLCANCHQDASRDYVFTIVQ